MKKTIAIVQLFILLIIIFPTQSLARTENFRVPDIKDDYCGAVMSVYNCKCAWHGQYCDQAGMDQGAAANYVTGAYNNWVAGLRQTFKQGCENGGGLFGGDACNYCDAGEFRVGAECRTTESLCSSDSRVSYNVESRRCECPIGFDIQPDYTCKSKCESSDPNMIFNQSENKCTCKSGFYLDEEEQKCLAICGDDPNLLYKEDTDECYCQEGYELEVEDDVYTCNELPDVDMNIEILGDPLPLIADGKYHTKFKVTLTNHSTRQGIEGARPELRSPASGVEPGTITNVTEDSPGVYIFDYTTPDLRERKDLGTATNMYLYIFYNSPMLDKEVYKTSTIDLTIAAPMKAKVTKPGFKDQEIEIPFTSNDTLVRVVVLNKQGEKVPVNDVEVALGEFNFEKTAPDGYVTMNPLEEVQGSKDSEVEVVLEVTDEVVHAKEQALKQYKQIIVGEKGITSDIVRDFIENFEKYLAEGDMWESEAAIVGLKRVGYTLLYMTEGKSLAFDLAKELGSSVSGAFFDIIDLLDLKGKIADKFEEYTKASVDDLKDKMAGKSVDLFKEKLPEIAEGLKEIDSLFEGGIINSLKNSIAKYAPNFELSWIEGLMSKLFPKDAVNNKDAVEKSYDIVHKASQGFIATLISDYLVDEFDNMLKDGMRLLEMMIQNKSFNKTGFEADRFVSKWESLDLRGTYLKAHEVHYNAQMIKNVADAINSSVIDGLKITVVWKKQAEALEKGYKALRSGVINNVELYYWFDAYGQFAEEVYNNINRGVGVKAVNFSFNSRVTLLDLFKMKYANALEGISEDEMNSYYEYIFSEDELSFLESAMKVNDIFAEIFPDDQDIIDTANMLEQNIDEQSAKVDELEEIADKVKITMEEEANAKLEEQKKAEEALLIPDKNYDKNDLNKDGKITLSDFTAAELGVLGVLILISLAVIAGIVKMFKKFFMHTDEKMKKGNKHNPFDDGLDQDGADDPFKD